MDAGSSSFTTFELRVETQTPGWEKTMIKILKGIPGATFNIDANGLARISGNIDPSTTLKLLAKAGKHAQMHWIDSGKRDQYHHHFDHPHGRYSQTNNYHQYHHHPHPLPPPPPPSQYLPQYTPSAPPGYFLTQ